MTMARDPEPSIPDRPVAPPRGLAAALVRLVPESVHPNHLTFLRLACAGGILVADLLGGGVAWIFILGFIAGWSDYLDGILARTRGQTTELGAFLDPLGDKVLALVVGTVMWRHGLVSGWLILAMLAVDSHAAVMPLGHMLSARRRGLPLWPAPKVRPNAWGKWKTGMLVVSLGLVLLGALLSQPWLMAYGRFWAWAAMILGVVASLCYYRDWRLGRWSDEGEYGI